MMKHIIFSVQFSHSRVWLSAIPCTTARQASVSISNSWSLLRLMSIESVMPSNHLLLCRPLLFPLSNFPSIRVFLFKWVSSSHQVANILEFQLQHRSSQWTFGTDFLYAGLVHCILFYKMLIKVHTIIQIKNSENHIA